MKLNLFYNPINKAKKYRENGLYEKLFKFTEKQITSDKLNNYDKGYLYYERGMGFFYTEDYQKSSDNFEGALKFLSKTNTEEKEIIASIYYFMSLLQSQEKERDKYTRKSFFMYKKLAKEHENHEYYTYLGELYFYLNCLEQSSKCFEKALSLSKDKNDSSDILARLGYFEILKQQYKEAKDYYLKALSEFNSLKNPSIPSIYLGLGKIEYELGNKIEAEIYLLKALKARNHSPTLKFSTFFEGDLNHCLGISAYDNNKISVALSYFLKAEECLDESYISYNNLRLYIGHCYLSLKEYTKSERKYEEVLQSEHSTKEEKDKVRYSLNRLAILRDRGNKL